MGRVWAIAMDLRLALGLMLLSAAIGAIIGRRGGGKEGMIIGAILGGLLVLPGLILTAMMFRPGPPPDHEDKSREEVT